MTTLVAHLDDIQHRLDALARRHHVPGAVLAVSQGDETLDFATGVINRSTGAAEQSSSLSGSATGSHWSPSPPDHVPAQVNFRVNLAQSRTWTV